MKMGGRYIEEWCRRKLKAKRRGMYDKKYIVCMFKIFKEYI